MEPGAVLSESWELYKRHWRHLLPIAFIVYVVVSLVSLLATAALGWVGSIIGALVSVAGVFLVQGALVEAVSDVRDGRADLSIGETFRRVQPRLGTLVGAGLLATLGIAAGFVLLIVPGLVLLTFWAFIIPLIVLEGAGIGDSFGRSRALVRGNGWNVFGLIVLTFVILIAVGIVLGLVLLFLPDWLASFISNLVSGALTAPFIAVVTTLAYFRLRERSSGVEPAVAPA